MNRRLIIVNLVLIMLLVILPREKALLAEAKSKEETKELAKEVFVTSRGTDEPRVIEPQIVVATEISQECIDFIKKKEGLVTTAKHFTGDKYRTIGYGHYGKDVREGQTISEEEAERLLMADLKGYTEAVLKECEHLALNENELSALVSFTYNCGLGNLKKLTKDRTKEEIAEHITAYTNSGSEANRKGLQIRREEEKEMFLGGI
jgi:GH24 family phage-related lysozyme (muramidase)